jgi:hypothetical protein
MQVLIPVFRGGAVVWAAARRYPDRFIAVAALCTPFRPRSKTFLTNFEVAQRLPMFYCRSCACCPSASCEHPSSADQHYFQSEHKQAAADLERDVTRTVRCIMRGCACLASRCVVIEPRLSFAAGPAS